MTPVTLPSEESTHMREDLQAFVDMCRTGPPADEWALGYEAGLDEIDEWLGEWRRLQGHSA